VRKTIFEIQFRFPGVLAITPRPRGGDWLEVDIAALSFQGVHVLVSLLEAEEAFELGLEGESASCAVNGIEFWTLPVPDLGTPIDSPKFVQAATDLAGVLRKGKCIAIHCRQSVGRVWTVSGIYRCRVRAWVNRCDRSGVRSAWGTCT
jgi:hypothetical protein